MRALTAVRYVLTPPRALAFPSRMVRLWPVLRTGGGGQRGNYFLLRMLGPLTVIALAWLLIAYYYLWIAYVVWAYAVLNVWLVAAFWGYLASIIYRTYRLIREAKT